MKQRIALWDNIKFLLIAAVVVGHLADWFTDRSGMARSLFLFLYSFHMPLFLFISGLFHSNRNIGRKCLFYLSAGYALKLLGALTSVLTGGSFYFSMFYESGAPWFMFVLAIFTALTYGLRRCSKWYLLGLAVVLACLAGYDTALGDTLCLSRAVVFYPFYLLGAILDPGQIAEWKQKHPGMIFPAVLTVVGAALACVFCLDRLYLYRYLFSGRNPYFDEIMSYAPLARLGCYAVSSAMGAAIIFLVPSRTLPGITRMGSRSIDVYFWHIFAYTLLEQALSFSRLYDCGPAGKLAFLLVGVGLTVLLSQGGIFSFPLRQIRAMCFSERAPLDASDRETTPER